MQRCAVLRCLYASMAFLFGTVGCSLLTDSEIAPAGVGAACKSSSDCQGSTCSNGICVAKCSVNEDCPKRSRCVQGLCHVPLRVAGVWVGLATTGEGWTLTHQDGIQQAIENLGYIDYAFREGLIGSPAEEAIDDFVQQGADVVIANSFDHRESVATKSAQYPDRKFLICSGMANGTNVGSYFGRLEQAWFVAGKVAAQKAPLNKRLGFVGSYITPEVVRHANAFTRGARSIDPEIVVEIRWVGFWYDYHSDPPFTYTPRHMGPHAQLLHLFAEEYAAAKLIDGGVGVIAHQCDNQRISDYVARHTQDGTLVDDQGLARQVYTIANDNQFGWRDSQGEPFTNALGATYWNWGPMYTRLLDDIHRHVWQPVDVMDVLIEDVANSTVGFELNTSTDIDPMQVRGYLNQEARRGYQAVFEGPFDTTGQRGAMGAGETLTEEEWRTMCWFVDGIVEKELPNDPDSRDIAAQVPDDGHSQTVEAQKDEPWLDPTTRLPATAPEVLLTLPELPAGVGWNCKENQ